MSEFFDRIDSMSPKRLALLAHELNDELERERARRHQPIAIVGMACRLPGGGDDPESVWTLLASGKDLITPAPSDRWQLDQMIAGRIPEAGFLGPVDGFDPLFFGISPREAETMDPQQRLLLEVTWEALENAAIAPDSLQGTRTGVFIGIAGNDFSQKMHEQDLANLDGYMASGGSQAVAAGRLSYTLDLAGPCVSINTACSSSLVAIADACDSLRLGRSDAALAGGVSLILTPDTTAVLIKAGMLSPTYRSRSFDAQADGFARGEGCGMLVLKRLDDAERDGDRIHAVIRGVAVNQDGRSAGLTAPSGPAQQALLRDALADAGLSSDEVQFVEAHGTGTSLGDPIEAQALTAVYGRGRTADNALIIGSIKSNMGHLEAAAGAAGMIKLILALDKGVIPPLVHLSAPNPHIDWANSGLSLARAMTPWPGDPAKRAGGVSSFGFSGTNAHLILGAAPTATPTSRAPAVNRSHHLFCLSARSPQALHVLAQRYRAHLNQHPDIDVADLCYSANQGRRHHAERVAFVVSDVPDLQARLDDFVQTPIGPKSGAEQSTVKLGFLFTGQGSQYAAMARGLYEAEPAFAAILDQCDAIFQDATGRSLTGLLYAGDPADAGCIDQTGLTQPALFALEVALAKLLISWGIRPAAMLGHSVGEFAAACIGGVFSLEDGLRLIARRAELMQALPPGGGMTAVLTEEATVRRLLTSFPTLSVAGLNGPTNIVVSGPLDELERLTTRLSQDDVAFSPLTVSHAFHSALLDPMLGDLARAADQIVYGDLTIPVMSNLTGREADDQDLRCGRYWRDHARNAVRFTEGARGLEALGCTTFVEVGPAPVLAGMARRFITDPKIAWLPTLRPGRPDLAQLLESVGELYVRGINIDFAAMYQHRPGRRLALPTYPFERDRYWPEITARTSESHAPVRPSFEDWLYEKEWQAEIDPIAATRAPAYIPETERLVTVVDLRVKEMQQDPDWTNDDRSYEAGDALCRDYIVEALAALGYHLPVGDQFTADALQAQLGVIDRHTKLFARMLAILAEDGILEAAAAGWVVAHQPENIDSRSRLQALDQSGPQFRVELTLLAECGPRLAEVLQGRCDPMPLLFPAGKLDLTAKLYSEPRPMVVFNGLVESAIENIVHALPDNRPIRILEVGAGTGGTTARVLPMLPPERAEYLFTDVSQQFLDRARERFAAFPFVDYDILNLENPLFGRDALLESFDIIIAANVVHATRDIQNTLDALRHFLKPQGLLLLLEVVQPQRIGDLTVGLTEGWWAFTDHELRPDYPLISRTAWTTVLNEAGFITAAAAPHGRQDNRILDNQALLFARRPAAQEEPASAASTLTASGRWLIYADQGGIGQSIAQTLEARGGETIIVSVTSATAVAQEIAINPSSLDDHTKKLAQAGEIRGVIYLWGLDARCDDKASPADVGEAVETACHGALRLCQALIAAHGRGLTILTRDEPAQAALWAMAGSAALEHPELAIQRVEISADATAEQIVDGLLQERDRALPIRITPRGRSTQKLARSPARQASSDAVIVRPDVHYLITGGLTGLGLLTARWLVDRGATRLVLVGRREPDAEAKAVLDEFDRRGVSIICRQADVGDPHDVDRLFAAIDASGVPLAGIVHSAGTLADAALLRLNWPNFEKTMRAKVIGAWNLHLHARKHTLDFFILYSSGASFLGSAGQANHAAANGFLDGLATWRRQQGLTALSINWGPWSDIGAAATHAVLDEAKRGGVEAIDVVGGQRALERLIAADRTQVAVLPIDWQRFDPSVRVDRAMFADFVSAAKDMAPIIATAPAAPAVDWQSRLSTAAPARRRTIIADLLEQAATRTLKLKSTQTVDASIPLSEYGMDSLMALQFRNDLAVAMAIELPPTLLYNYPTLDQLADYLLGLQFEATPQRAAEVNPVDLDDASEDELARMLAELIDDAPSPGSLEKTTE
jgi:acyl transferase domain-containing protein